MIVVTDSGPLIHLAAVNQFHLLNQFFQHLLITPQVHEEVVTVEEVADRALIDRLTVPNISKTDATVIATALVHHAKLLLADDIAVRTVAMRERLTVMGTIGILVHARLEGSSIGYNQCSINSGHPGFISTRQGKSTKMPSAACKNADKSSRGSPPVRAYRPLFFS